MRIFLFILAIFGINCLDERQLEISELPVSKFIPPNCDYTTRHDDRHGKLVKNSVTVGDPIYHQWNCSSTGGLYCIMVHSCTLGESETKLRGRKIEIIDEFGCSIFPELVPNMNYFGDTEAGFRANAFLIDIDQMSIFFKCSVKFLVKLNGHCRRPLCPR